MTKRIIALLLALILTVGLLPTVALAAEGGETPTTGTGDVKNGYYEGTTWKEGPLNQGKLPTGVESVSKTAKPTSNPNEYEVTLEVVLKKTESQENPGSAATVLVLDHSGSMNGCAYCKSTTDDGVNYYHTEGCKYDKPHQWVMVTSEQSRMSAATKAVKDFIKTYSGRFDENGQETTIADLNLGRWVCLVWFNKKGGVTGGGDWVDVSNKSGYQTATNTNGWKAHDGTNLDCGLRLADHWLKQSPVASINKSLKNVIVLSDGEPTFYLSKGVSIKGSIKIGNTTYYVHGSGKDCKKDTYNTTKITAATLRNSASVYTVCFGASGNEIKDYDKNGNQKITVGNYLKQKIATQPKTGSQETFAYDAANADALNKAFAAITNTIVSGLSTGTVKDTLPTGITVSEADKQKFGTGTWELNSKAFNKTEETKQLADGTKETVYTYTKTYTVTIDPDDEKLVTTKDGYAPLNGKTTLTVKNSQGTDVEIPFPIPAGKVTMPSYTVTGTIDNNGAVTGSGQTVNAGGSSAAMTFTPAAGYEIKTITEKIGDGQPTPITFTDKNSYTYPAKDNVKADIKVTVTTQKRTDLSYTVKYVDKDTNVEIRQSETTSNQQFGAEINVAKMDKLPITGYTYNSCSPTDKLTIGTGENVIILYYTRNEYKVTYEYTGDIPTNPAPTPVPSEATCKYEANVMIAAAPAPVSGYTFEGWKREDGTEATNFTMPANDVKITGNWKKNGDGTYKLEYWLEKLDGTYENTETITGRTGTIGTTASVTDADKKQITGFTFDADNVNNVLSDTISADGSLTLKLYYTRNSYTVKYQYTGTVPKDATGLPAEATYKYGAEVTVTAAATSADHVFSGWSKTGKFNMPAEDVIITGSWTQATYDVNLSSYVKKALEVNGTLPSDFTFEVEVTVDGQPLQQKGTVTMTAAGTSNFTMPTVALTTGTHTIMVQEVVDEQTKNSNIAYDTNQKTFVLNIPTSGAAAPVQYGTTDAEGNFVEVKEPAFVTITNTYTEPKNAQVTNKEVVVTQPEGALKTAVNAFEIPSQVTVLYPTGNGTTSNTLEVSYGTTAATLLYKITVYAGTESSYTFEDKDASFVYAENAKTVTKNGDYFTVTFEDGAEYAYVYVAVTHAISYDADGEYKARNFIGSQGAETTVTEKDPNKLYINFADFVKKELTATGTKTASDVDFTVDVKEFKTVISSIQGEEEVNTYAGEQLLSTTLNAHFDSITGGETKTAPFNGSIVVEHAGTYSFELTEEDGQRTGVTYDDSTYKVYVYVKREGDKLVVGSFDIYKDGWSVAGETITFHNTIDTGKDDYYPIIIPAIINKDTGMLNKTDHFAYVIGYPDGTVHPNGQITRAEVATIFFRLLRDEVRDGAFTTSNSYSDVAYGKWYNNPISTMSALGIITGYPDGTFKPNKPITRAEFAAIAARFDETQSGKSATFSDVIGHWAAKEIGIAYYNDWIKGYPDGTFKPDQNITRAEAMTLINRVLERKPESPADLLTNMNKWTDNLDTSKWYYLDVQEATNSHGYTRKTFNYELWRQMLPDPDWSRYER